MDNKKIFFVTQSGYYATDMRTERIIIRGRMIMVILMINININNNGNDNDNDNKKNGG